jgi:hypothetical protein
VAVWHAATVRRLTAVERSAYDHVPAGVAARARIQRVPLLPPHADAMTLGPFVLVRRDEMRHRTGRRELLAHELVHVRQWAELGVTRFLWRYLRGYASNRRRLRRHYDAYLAIPLEVEARAEAGHWAVRRPPTGS